MQELAQIEGHGLSPQMELAEKFTNLHTHTDKTVQHTETRIMMDLAVLIGILLICMHNLVLPEN